MTLHIKFYANENSLQRGNTNLAEAGAVAAALKLLTKRSAMASGHKFVTGRRQSPIRENLKTGVGIGEKAITAFDLA